MKQLHSRFPITEMNICGLIHRLATSPVSGVFIITAAAVYQINHKGKAQSYTSPLPPLFLFPLLYCFPSVEKFPVLFKLIWWARMGRERYTDNYNTI